MMWFEYLFSLLPLFCTTVGQVKWFLLLHSAPTSVVAEACWGEDLVHGRWDVTGTPAQLLAVLELHRLLAFIVIVLSSPFARALRADLCSRKHPGVTYSMDENEPTWAEMCHLFCPAQSLLVSLLLLIEKNVNSSQNEVYYCSRNIIYFLCI